MAVKISGVLKDGTGKPVQNCTIQLKAKRNSTTVVVNTLASENPDEAGRYSMDVEYGQYSVILLVEGFPPSHAGTITVYEDSRPGTLNDFLGAMTEDDARPEALRRFELMVEEVARNASAVAQNTAAAKKSAGDAGTSAREAATHATDAAGSARAASTSAGQAATSAQSASSSAGTASTKATEASKSAAAAESSKSAAATSAGAAKTSETNAAASQKSAATSASAATTKASEAATSARDASASKEAAKSSETNASSSASSAASSATAAGNSAKAAKTSETNARSSETAAGQSASAAAGSKTAAASSASAASTSAGQASASATAAGKSAESAASSASTATTKAGEATEQATAAARSASAAKTSETNAKASETSAESSKTAAASSASSAASSASSASASKDEATRQASAAKGSATTASTKATEAAGSATAAAQSKSTAESAATRAETAAKRAEDIASAVALEDASTTKKGVVQLSSATNSTSESQAATPKAVKAAYDLANGKYTAQDATTAQKGIVQLSSATNSASETLAATPKAVKAANDNANGRVPSARKVNGKALSADITLTPKDIGTLNSTTMSFSGGAGWFKLATVTMPQASSIVYIALIGGAGYNVGSPHQAGISELVLRAGNGNPKGITGALWKRTAVGLTNFAWINTSGDTYDIYVEIGNYATSVNIHWDCTANATVSIYTSPTYSASKPSSVTDGVVYTMYSTHQKPTPLDIGALPTTGGTVSGPLSVTGGITGTLNGNASTATKLQTARSIGGVGFDGSANINLPGVNTTGNQNTTGNAATATKLQTARTIGGVSFDGTANINLPGVNTAGNQSTTGNAATATKLQTARTINGVKFDGSADITLTPANLDVYSKSEIDNKKGMRKYTFSAPANAVSGKWYPIVFRRSRGSTDELASRVVITTGSSVGGYAMNNCEFNGFVMPGGWSDRGSYAAGFFSIYSTAERAIHSIISSVKDDDLCSVFYVEARAFPIKIFAEEGLNVIVPTADYAVGQTTYKWGATDPLSESTNAQIILDFKNGRGYYCSHPFISSLSGNAATATKLQTARTIGGVAFDGSANINLPGVNTAGNQNTTGNAATATKLQTARNINGVKFDGSGDININTLVSRGRVTALSGSTQGTAGIQMYEAYSTSYPTMYGNVLHMKGASAAGEGELLIGWSGTSGAHAPVFIRSRRDTTDAAWSAWAQVYTAKDSIPGVNTTGNQNTTGNAATATKLQTARKIAGVAFDGSADITLTAANLNAYTKTEVTNLLSSYVKSSALPSMTVRTSSVSGGDMGMSLSAFISHLKSNGAFSKSYWIGFGDAMGFNAGSINNITGFGAVELAESIIEVFNLPNGDYTIRLTTSHKADYGGVTNAILVYHYRSNRSPSGQWLKFAGTVGATSN